MQDYFNDAFKHTMSFEGGYGHDPDDPGGETKFGICKRSYPQVDIASLTVDDAKKIYRSDFWKAPCFDMVLSKSLALKLFDLGVNIGPRRTIALLQLSSKKLGSHLLIDGRLGPITLAWVNGFRHQDALLMALRIEAGKYYMRLNRQKYLAGWLKRLAA